MSNIKRFVSLMLALIMMFSCVSVISTSATDTKNAQFEIKMGKYVDGTWTETTEVTPGEEVTARIFLTTDFPAGTGEYIFYYDRSFYEDDYTLGQNLDSVNPYYKALNYVATVSSESCASTRLKNRVNSFTSAEDQVRYSWVYVTLDALNVKNTVYNGSEYLFEIELKVKDNASGSGWFTILEDSFASETTNPDGLFNINWGSEDEYIGAEGHDMLTTEEDDVTFNITVLPDEDGDYMTVADSENQLVITTKFFRTVDGKLVETDRAKRGETLTARVYVETAYPTNSGELMFFYDNSFFSDDYSSDANTLTVNSSASSYTAQQGITGLFYNSDSTGTQARVNELIANGCITSDYAAANNCFFISYETAEGKTNVAAYDDTVAGADAVVDNDLWFCEFTLTVADDAEDEGKLDVNNGTICTPDTEFGGINVPKGQTGSADTYGMYLWDADVSTYLNPVSLESTITFNANGGTLNGTTDTTYDLTGYIGEDVDEADVPTAAKEGATFEGWYLSTDSTQTVVDLPETFGYEDVTYIAKWTDNVTVSFDTQGGTEVASVTGAIGSAFDASAVAAPTKDGYGFAGWSLTADGSATALPSVFPNTDTTYYALWEENAYPVTYKVKNESTSSEYKTVSVYNIPFGEAIPTSAYSVPVGYDFDGWYTDEDLTTPLAADAKMQSSELTVYGKITAKTINAIFKLDGGNIAGSTDDVTVPTQYLAVINAPADPVKDGYDFKGWTPDVQSGVSVMDQTTDKVYTATWSPKTYEIKYYLDNTTTSVYEQDSYAVGETVDNVADPFITGKTFGGWTYVNADTDEAVNFDGTMPACNVKAVAKWTDDEYTLSVIYRTEDGSIIEGVKDYEATGLHYNDAYSVDSPTVTGYELVDDTQATVSGSMPAQDIEIIVNYKLKEHTAKWIVDGTTVEETTYKFGESITKRDDPTKEGYTFRDWTIAVPATMPDEDLTFIAEWDINTHKLTINYICQDDNSVMATAYEQTFDYNAAYSVDSPAATGHHIVDATQATISGNMPDKDVEITVYYTADVHKVNVTYVLAEGDTLPAGVTLPENVEKDVAYGEDYAVYTPEIEGLSADKDKVAGTMGTEDVNETVTYTVGGHTMTVHYVYADGTKAAEDVTGTVKYGASYSYTSPEVTGYDPDKEVVEGTMPNEDVEITVTYTANDYDLVINYVYADGTTAAEKVEKTLAYGTAYECPSPEITGYSPDKVSVSGTMDENGVDVTIIYTPNNYTLTVNYEMADGETIPSGVTLPEANVSSVAYNSDYSVPTPVIEGLTPDITSVDGTMDDVNGKTATVKYTVNKHDVTVNYVYEDGTTAAEKVVNTLAYGTDYNYASPEIPGYTADKTAVSGTMPDKDVEETVTYKANVHHIKWIVDGVTVKEEDLAFGTAITKPDTPEKTGYTFNDWTDVVPGTMPDNDLTFVATWTVNTHTLTVNYVLAEGETLPDGVTLPETHTETVDYNKEYSVPSPEVAGFTASPTAVSGTMPDKDVTETVEYTAGGYTLTVHYVYADGTKAADDSVYTVKYGKDYSYDVSEKEGYTASPATVAGTMPDENTEVTVTYTANKYTLTVIYYYEDGTPAAPTVTKEVTYKDTYTVNTPNKPGYDASQAVVTGEMPAKDVVVKVTYTAEALPLTVEYKMADGETLPDGVTLPTAYTDNVQYKGTYSVDTPDVTGLTPDRTVVTGTMDNTAGKTETVYYTVNKHNVTVNYVMSDGSAAPDSKTESNVPYGTDYSIATPEVTGYTPDKDAIAGTMADADVTATVTYTLNEHTLTVEYVYEDGTTASATYTEKVGYNKDYSVESPAIEGYTPDTAKVEGTMPDKDVSEKVTYSAKELPLTVEYKMADGETLPAGVTLPDTHTENVKFNEEYTVKTPDVTGLTADRITVTGTMDNAAGKAETVYYTVNKHNITVNYVMSDGSAAPAAQTQADVPYGTAYSIASPAVTGYTPDKDAVAGNMGDSDITETVTYKPNQHTVEFIVDGASVQKDTLDFGTAITKPTDPAKEGYTFTGWSPEVAATVPDEDVTYTAQWQVNTHNLTITYVYDEDGSEAATTYTSSVDYGTAYSVDSPEIKGYTASETTVSGTMPDKDLSVEVRYIAGGHSVTITYTYADGSQADSTKVYTVAYGKTYDYATPEVTGYSADKASVAGTMGEDDVTATVTYTPNNYTLTVNYEMSDGTTAPAAHTEDVAYNADYTVASPEVTGYTPDITTVSGTMDSTDGKTVTVKYTPNKYDLTVNYVMADGSAAPEAHTEKVDFNDKYYVASPVLTGYTPDFTEVTGIMDSTDGKTVTVTYTPNTHKVTVTYDVPAGVTAPETKSEDVVYNNTYSITSPEIEGYTPDQTVVEGTMGDADVNVTVTYKVNQHTYNIDPNGGTYNGTTAVTEKTYNYNDNVSAEPTEADPTRSGYSFGGWIYYSYSSKAVPAGKGVPATATVIDKPATMPDYDVWAEAQWKGPGHATFYEDYANDKATIIAKTSGTDEETITIPAAPTKTGYIFQGWAEVDPDTQTIGSAVAADTIGNYTAEGNRYFTAVWKEDIRQANFNANGGTWSTGNDPEVTEGRIGTAITDPRDNGAALTRKGYSFIGYGTTADATTPVGSLGNYAETTPEFYAIWEPNVAIFNAGEIDGSEGTFGTTADGSSINSVAIDGEDAGTDITDKVKIPTNGGYEFDGWTDEDGNKYDSITEMPEGTHTYTAQWKNPGDQNINFYPASGSTVPSDTYTAPYNSALAGTDAETTFKNGLGQTGKNHLGWVDKDGNAVSSLPDKMPKGGLDLYEVTEDIKYTATFDANGGDWSGETSKSATYSYGDTISVPVDPAAPTEDVVFAGWSIDGTNPVSISTMPANDVTYKAIWKDATASYTVTYQNEDGTTLDTQTYKAGAYITTTSLKPSKSGYTFQKWEWYTEDGTKLDSKPTDMPEYNLIAKPVFTKNPATAVWDPIREEPEAAAGKGGQDGSPNEYSGEYGGEYSGEYGSEYKAISGVTGGTVYEPNYTPTTHKSSEKVPHTGSSFGTTIFAAVSAAAAAAYVAIAGKKKKDDED